MCELQTLSYHVEGNTNKGYLYTDGETIEINGSRTSRMSSSPAASKYRIDKDMLPDNNSKRVQKRRMSSMVDTVHKQTQVSTEATMSRRRVSSMVNIVGQLTQVSIDSDIHPFGRGHLYKNVLGDGEQDTHRDDDTMLICVVATLIVVLAMVFGIIAMAEMYNNT